jgi:adenylate cyclase, class 2
MTRIEVEKKFPVPDLSQVERELDVMGVRVLPPKTEVDLYYQHPSRDFAATDEALRIRRTGKSSWITYKGPKIDRTTKTRREIDLPLPEGTGGADSWAELLKALGFVPRAEVRKQRRKAHAAWQGTTIEVSLDEVDQVGTFVELEIVTDTAGVESAKLSIQSLAARLGLVGGERRSYLELLLERQQAGK